MTKTHAAQTSRARRRSSTRSQILVVEDCAPLRRIVLDLLHAHGGYAAHAVPSVEEAMAYVGEHSVDLVITDLSMPGRSGYELITWLRSDACGPFFQDAPIIALTGHSSSKALKAAMNAGVTDFLAKPVVPKTLHERVAAALRGATAHPKRAARITSSAGLRRPPVLDVRRDPSAPDDAMLL